MLILIVYGSIGRAVMHPRLPTDDHVSLDPTQDRAAHDGRPGVQRLHDLDRPVLADRARHGVSRALGIRWRRSAREVTL